MATAALWRRPLLSTSSHRISKPKPKAGCRASIGMRSSAAAASSSRASKKSPPPHATHASSSSRASKNSPPNAAHALHMPASSSCAAPPAPHPRCSAASSTHGHGFDIIDDVPGLFDLDEHQEAALLYPFDIHSDPLLLPPSCPSSCRPRLRLPDVPARGDPDVLDRFALCIDTRSAHQYDYSEAESRLPAELVIRKLMAAWHKALALPDPFDRAPIIRLALHLLRRLPLALGPLRLQLGGHKITRLSLAVCFWVASKLLDDGLRAPAPPLETLEIVTRVEGPLIIHGEARLCELGLLDLHGWRPSSCLQDGNQELDQPAS